MPEPAMDPKVDHAFLDNLITQYRHKPGALLAILESAQDHHPRKYLTKETLEYIGKEIGVSRSQIYNVVTFYSFFNLTPQGDHSITICRGTACHARGSKKILDFVKNMLQLQETNSGYADKLCLTTPDNRFTVRTVACFGQCALAPVVSVDERIYGYMTCRKIREIIEKLDREPVEPVPLFI
ncbi:MAG TPA: NAD(P)H-dependent oxidoreductase subunit E [bacterium]|nr:NAD(P)H-dependent oxidoreductase subunit E [bacterium]HQL63341.1 NAD(P)H-dependent oxidoreductase subunit E [bacterium]